MWFVFAVALLTPLISAATVPVPTVSGPVVGGARGMWGASVVDPRLLGYVEEEYFISGTAAWNRLVGLVPDSSRNDPPGSQKPYTTRIVVRRPVDPTRFNGTVVVEWYNVSFQYDVDLIWLYSYSFFADKGFVSVSVSAQKQGVDGSPAGLKFYDPVRYGSLSHPGDSYAFDIYSQATEALRTNGSAGGIDPMGGLRVERVLATGWSQSAGALGLYINRVAKESQVVDGFALIGSDAGARRDVAPTLLMNSETPTDLAIQLVPPDNGLFRYWEIAGGSHVSWWTASWMSNVTMRGEVGTAPDWDERNIGQYGERGGGPCPQNFFPDRYAYRALFYYLDRWVRNNLVPPAAPRFERDCTGALVRDADGNVKGGLRLPPIDVPVATYRGDQCPAFTRGQLGDTVPFDPVKLATLYPSHADYVAKMQAKTDAAVAAGYMLPDDADDLMTRVRLSHIGETPLQTLTISGNFYLSVGQSSQLVATAQLSDGTRGDVTASVSWRADCPGVATISAHGLVVASSVGICQINAQVGALGTQVTITVH